MSEEFSERRFKIRFALFDNDSEGEARNAFRAARKYLRFHGKTFQSYFAEKDKNSKAYRELARKIEALRKENADMEESISEFKERIAQLKKQKGRKARPQHTRSAPSFTPPPGPVSQTPQPLRGTFRRKASKVTGLGMAAALCFGGWSYFDSTPFNPEDAHDLLETSVSGRASALPSDPYTNHLMLNVVLNTAPISFYHTQRVWTDITQKGKSPEQAVEDYIRLYKKTDPKTSRRIPLSVTEQSKLREFLTKDIVNLLEIASSLSGVAPTPDQLADRFIGKNIPSGSPDASAVRRAIIEFENQKPGIEDALRFGKKRIWGIYPDPVRSSEEYANLLRIIAKSYQTPPSQIDTTTALSMALADIDALLSSDRRMSEGLIIDKRHPQYQMSMLVFGNDLRLSLCSDKSFEILVKYSYPSKRRTNLWEEIQSALKNHKTHKNVSQMGLRM